MTSLFTSLICPAQLVSLRLFLWRSDLEQKRLIPLCMLHSFIVPVIATDNPNDVHKIFSLLFFVAFQDRIHIAVEEVPFILILDGA